LLFLISPSLSITTENHDWIMNQSKTIPVLGFLHFHHCGHCKKVYSNWAALSDRSASDPGVLAVQCDCADDRAACEATTKINSSSRYRGEETKFVQSSFVIDVDSLQSWF
jgi:hypothetical protein